MATELKYDAKIKGMVLKDADLAVSPQFQLELNQLNTLTAELMNDTAPVPPKPSPESFIKRSSKMIEKLNEGGVQLMDRGKYIELAKQFSIAIEIVNRRNKFEAFQDTFQELLCLLKNRASAYIRCKEYLRAFNDADMLINMMVCTQETFLKRGVASYLLGNYEDARADYERGLSCDIYRGGSLGEELGICRKKILEENGDLPE